MLNKKNDIKKSGQKSVKLLISIALESVCKKILTILQTDQKNK